MIVCVNRIQFIVDRMVKLLSLKHRDLRVLERINGQFEVLRNWKKRCSIRIRVTLVREFHSLSHNKYHSNVTKYFTRAPNTGEFLAIRMNANRGIPNWVAYRVTSKLWEKNKYNEDTGVPRTPSFYKDPDVSFSISDGDYKKQPDAPALPSLSGKKEKAYVRGHVAPNKVFSYSTITEVTSNFYSNVAPQLGVANHPYWFNNAENKLLSLINSNEDLIYYVVSGTAGGIQGFRKKSCLHVSVYPSEKAYSDPKFRDAIPALWFTAYVSIDANGDIQSSGGWIGENHYDMKSKNVEVKSFDHVEDLESELRSCCESSSSKQNCDVNLFPGLKDATTAPSCADRRLVKECKFANLEENRCSDYCTSQGTLFTRGPHVCGDSSSTTCTNGASLDNEARYKCRDECGKNTEPPKIPQSCDDLSPVRSCKSLGHSKEECERSCMCSSVSSVESITCISFESLAQLKKEKKTSPTRLSNTKVRITALFSMAMHIVVNS